jgi:hypothetical protein
MGYSAVYEVSENSGNLVNLDKILVQISFVINTLPKHKNY